MPQKSVPEIEREEKKRQQQADRKIENLARENKSIRSILAENTEVQRRKLTQEGRRSAIASVGQNVAQSGLRGARRVGSGATLALSGNFIAASAIEQTLGVVEQGVGKAFEAFQGFREKKKEAELQRMREKELAQRFGLNEEQIRRAREINERLEEEKAIREQERSFLQELGLNLDNFFEGNRVFKDEVTGKFMKVGDMLEKSVEEKEGMTLQALSEKREQARAEKRKERTAQRVEKDGEEEKGILNALLFNRLLGGALGSLTNVLGSLTGLGGLAAGLFGGEALKEFFGPGGVMAQLFGKNGTVLKFMKGLTKFLGPLGLIVGAISAGSDALKGFLADKPIDQILAKFTGDLLDFISFGLLDAEKIKNDLSPIFAKLFDSVKKIFEEGFSWPNIKALTEGIIGTALSPVDWVVGALSDISEWILDKLGFRDASKKLDQFTEQFDFDKMAVDIMNNVIDFVKGIVNKIMDFDFEEFIRNSLGDTAADIMFGIKTKDRQLSENQEEIKNLERGRNARLERLAELRDEKEDVKSRAETTDPLNVAGDIIGLNTTKENIASDMEELDAEIKEFNREIQLMKAKRRAIMEGRDPDDVTTIPSKISKDNIKAKRSGLVIDKGTTSLAQEREKVGGQVNVIAPTNQDTSSTAVRMGDTISMKQPSQSSDSTFNSYYGAMFNRGR